MAIIFDGYRFALEKEEKLKLKTQAYLDRGIQPSIRAILFKEDEGSQLYTRLKQEAAERTAIEYQVAEFSFKDPLELIVKQIEKWNQDKKVTGIIIQKPWTKRFVEVTGKDKVAFKAWWAALASSIAVKRTHGVNKDIDGLHPDTLASIKAGSWREEGLVLPATARATLSILQYYKNKFDPDFCYCQEQILIVGKSDLLGWPLFWHMQNFMQCSLNKGEACSVTVRHKNNDECGVKLVGRSEFNKIIEQKKSLEDFTLIISATGQKNLITGDLIAGGTILVDIGEPQGDLDFESCIEKATFITPVPGGVGPMTVISLLANSLDLLKNQGV